RRGVPARRRATRGAPHQGRSEQRGARQASVPRARQPRVPASASARASASCARGRANVANVDKGVLDQAERLARINAASLNGPAPENLVHGDLHFENVLYDKGEITALLDFEFAR